MVPIEKNTPPRELLAEIHAYKAENGMLPAWDEVRCKPEVTASLVSEQGGLCAYCMARIRATREGSITDAHVEHIHPQSKSSHGEDIDYDNMLAVCEGKHGEGSTSWSCDRSRGNKKLTVNPLSPQTLRSIRYRSDGTIIAEDEAINIDLNVTLNLNGQHTGLKQNRKAVIDRLFVELQRVAKRAGRDHEDRAVKKYCRERLASLSKVDKNGCYLPYVGVLRYFLERRLKR